MVRGIGEDGTQYPSAAGQTRRVPPSTTLGASRLFNWFSLDIIYYPVSAIMWAWYKLFGLLLGPSNFFAWGLSVMFLVFTALSAKVFRWE